MLKNDPKKIGGRASRERMDRALEVLAILGTLALTVGLVLWVSSVNHQRCKDAYGPGTGYNFRLGLCVVDDNLKQLP